MRVLDDFMDPKAIFSLLMDDRLFLEVEYADVSQSAAVIS